MKPFFNYFGAKWRAAYSYPPPRFDTIVEPFAGAAGYATRYPRHQVVLCDLDPIIAGVWRFLIASTPDEILALPDIPDGAAVGDLHVCQEAKWLIGFYVTAAAHTPNQRPSAWAKKYFWRDQFWSDRARRRIASQVSRINHWRVYECNYRECPVTGPATWFVDPPYQQAGKRYRFGSKLLDYGDLATWCQSREGQVIVCENEGADWLSFRWHREIPSCRWRGPTDLQTTPRTSREVIWTNDNIEPQVVLL